MRHGGGMAASRQGGSYRFAYAAALQGDAAHHGQPPRRRRSAKATTAQTPAPTFTDRRPPSLAGTELRRASRARGGQAAPEAGKPQRPRTLKAIYGATPAHRDGSLACGTDEKDVAASCSRDATGVSSEPHHGATRMHGKFIPGTVPHRSARGADRKFHVEPHFDTLFPRGMFTSAGGGRRRGSWPRRGGCTLPR